MCGIAGVISSTPLSDKEIQVVHEMTGRMIHRGPDSSGMFVDNFVAMGMRRLSIIDLAGGDQPIFNENRDIAIVCNGEIYNHPDLRMQLKARGHHFRSYSDVETIVHLYEDYGHDCLQFLRGMFAFALWDGRQNTLLLARDRIGEKPLYLYHGDRGRLWFASEIRSIMATLRKAGVSLVPEAINLFLTFQYVPEPATLLQGVSILPAGHFLSLRADQIHQEPRQYWDFLDSHACEGDPVERVGAALDEACLLMGTADVPVGVALSAGIDSSLVAALTAKHYPGQIHAFSVGYPGRPESDERAMAERFAGTLGIPFSEVEVSTDDVVSGFPELVLAMDTPIGDIAAQGYYAVSQAARAEGVPVLLSGMGGDEMFWGYEWVRQAVARNHSGAGFKSWPSWFRKLFGGSSRERPTFYEVHDELRLGDLWSRQIFTPQALERVPDAFWLDCASIDRAARIDTAISALLIRTWLRSNCLALVDRLSMAHSVEMRLPLLDTKSIDILTGLRNAGLEDWKKPHKWLLIKACEEVLPPEVLQRKKQGFTPPVHTWLSKITATYRSLLNNGALVRRGILNSAKIASMTNVSGTFLYKLIILEVWTRLVIEGSSASDIFSEVSEPGNLRTEDRFV